MIEPNAATIPYGYEVIGAPMARLGCLIDVYNGRYCYIVIARGVGGLTYHEAAARCRSHYYGSRMAANRDLIQQEDEGRAYAFDEAWGL